jgi:hypothetical protein
VREERFGSTRWNPLEEISLGTDLEFSELLQVITMIVDPTGKQIDGDNGHWFKTSRVVIKALALKVLYDPLEPIKSVGRVADIFGSAGGPQNEAQAAIHRDTDGAPPASIEEMLEQFMGFSARGFGSTPSWLTRSIANDRRERDCRRRRTVGGRTPAHARREDRADRTGDAPPGP